MKNFADNWLVNTLIAHRGYHSNNEYCPENSLPAFEKAIENRFGIELDIHLIQDGNLVVFHDENLVRMTGVNRMIHTCSLGEIEEVSLLKTQHKIPLFKDVLKVVDGQVPILIEIKNPTKSNAWEEALCELLIDYEGPFAVQSFNPFSVLWFRKNKPDITSGLLCGHIDNTYNQILQLPLDIDLQYLLDMSSPQFLNYDIRFLPDSSVTRLKKNGMPILGWTAHSYEEYADAQKNCDNIVFEGFDPRGL